MPTGRLFQNRHSKFPVTIKSRTLKRLTANGPDYIEGLRQLAKCYTEQGGKFVNYAEICEGDHAILGCFPTADMQTTPSPPPPSQKWHLDIKDAQCALKNDWRKIEFMGSILAPMAPKRRPNNSTFFKSGQIF